MDSQDTENDSKTLEQETDEFYVSSSPTVKAGLYLVATPIGNLRDISLRALDVLRTADVLICEDTRVTRKLLSVYGIKTRMQVYNDHSDEARRSQVVGQILAGKKIALVSDAGMPLISDPGYKLVQACWDAGAYVTTIPGASAPLSALQLSGLPCDCFSFLGFFPNKTNARRKILKDWMNISTTLISFETAPRLLACLADIAEIMGERKMAVVREITKLFEEVRKGSASDLISYYVENGLPKGEIVLVIAPPTAVEISSEDLDYEIRNALKTMRTKEAAVFVSSKTGKSSKELYEIALKISNESL